jgi:tetratricopeptide (TPR) repeat protein
MQAADQTAQRAVIDQLDALNFMQNFLVTPLYAEVRFGQWDTVLAQPQPPGDRPYPAAIWHFARGLAYTRQGNLPAARTELAALEQTARDPAMEKLVLGDINRADRLLAVAASLLRGELDLAGGKRDAGIAALRNAVKVEDTLNYNEPADWPLPARMYLGAALLDAGQPREAAEVYREDLHKYPKNGWSLYGLAQAQRAMGETSAAAETEAQQKAAWQWADTPLTASRF